jgi:hypothetical protein
MHDHDHDADAPSNGQAPEHPGSYAVFLANEAARTRAHMTGLAVPTPANVAAHATPEQPRTGLRPASAPADERLRVLLYELRNAADLPRAIRIIREAGATGTPLPDGLLDRCDVAERAFLVHYHGRLAELTAIVREATRDVMEARGLGEFAAALVSNNFGKLLEGPR